MARLAEYMADVAALLGEKPSVHFVSVEEGSAALVQEVDHEAYPKVRTRVQSVKQGDALPEARHAYESLNRRLAEDNASGTLMEDPAPESGQRDPARVLDFPGRKEFVELEYGPLTQPGSLQGVVIVVGGESDPVPVHLQDGDAIQICRAKRPLAKDLATHLFGSPVRVNGNGRWFRDAAGQWVMKHFTISDYTVLRDDALSIVIARLRGVQGRWKQAPDVVNALRKLRTDEG